MLLFIIGENVDRWRQSVVVVFVIVVVVVVERLMVGNDSAEVEIDESST